MRLPVMLSGPPEPLVDAAHRCRCGHRTVHHAQEDGRRCGRCDCRRYQRARFPHCASCHHRVQFHVRAASGDFAPCRGGQCRCAGFTLASQCRCPLPGLCLCQLVAIALEMFNHLGFGRPNRSREER